MKKLILSIIMALFLTGIVSALEIQLNPQAVFFNDTTGFDVYGNVRYDLGNFWEQVEGLEAGIGLGYSYVSLEEDISSLNAGGLISYNYSINRFHTRASLFTGARLCFIDGTNANFMLMPNVEVGYEVIDNITTGLSLGSRFVFCEETEISLPLGAFISYSF